MKRIYIAAVFVFTLFIQNQLIAQKFAKTDKNPTDITYLRPSRFSKPLVKVIYSRPKKQSDVVFGEQVPFGKIWRTGDNEATEVKFYNDVKIGGTMVEAGTYILQTIPDENEWTIILNSNTDTWGATFYDESKDVLRIKVPAEQAENLEIFSIGFRRNYNKTFMVLGWDTTRVRIPIETGYRILADL